VTRARALDLSCTAAERAWAALLAVAEARGPQPKNAGDCFGLDAAGGLCPTPCDDPAALLRWHPAEGWAAATSAPAAAAAVIELYLPVLNASLEAPLVVGHLGQSLDGFIATQSGDSDYVTGPQNILHLHRMRALCDAVIVGAETVAADDPSLTARHAGGHSPVRVVIDPRRRLAPTRGVFTDSAAPTLLVCDAAHAERGSWPGMDIIGLPSGPAGLDLAALLSALHARSLASVFVEGGGKTVSAFLAQGLLDRLQIAVAPIVIGSGRPGVQLPARQQLAECMRLAPRIYIMGGDVFFDCDLRSETPR